VATASVFSLIAYRTALRLSLPKVSYMTRADIFVLGATVLVFGALGAAIATGRLAKSGREKLARKIDGWARWMYVAMLLILLIASRNW
jgi:F0F1-type ATP synthase membrane subunit c/vacuolar-type H+-ATPase subunit K